MNSDFDAYLRHEAYIKLSAAANLIAEAAAMAKWDDLLMLAGQVDEAAKQIPKDRDE